MMYADKGGVAERINKRRAERRADEVSMVALSTMLIITHYTLPLLNSTTAALQAAA